MPAPAVVPVTGMVAIGRLYPRRAARSTGWVTRHTRHSMAGVFFLVQATLIGDDDLTYGVPVEADDWAHAVTEARNTVGPEWEIDDIDPALLGRIEAIGDDVEGPAELDC